MIAGQVEAELPIPAPAVAAPALVEPPVELSAVRADIGSVSDFSFEGAPVRTVTIDGETWFVGKDVAERLGYAKPHDAMDRHCKGSVKRGPLQTAGGVQEVRLLREPDVLRLIAGSNLPAAERFERGVFEEVLPSIRKVGGYMVAAPQETPEELALRAMAVLQATVDRERAQRVEAQQRPVKAEQIIEEVRPKVEVHDRIVAADGSLTITEAAKSLYLRRSRPSAPRPAHLGTQNDRKTIANATDLGSQNDRTHASGRAGGDARAVGVARADSAAGDGRAAEGPARRDIAEGRRFGSG
jgi:prophage antirepressor-like protein